MATLLPSLGTEGASDTVVRPVLASSRLSALDVALLAFAVLATHLLISGPIPSGGDGGNWLALAREMSGQSAMSAEVTYEPLFIGLIALLTPMLGLVIGLLAGALLAEISVVAGIYVIGRLLGRTWGILAATSVLLLGYRLEAFAWGAYPQMLALGLGLLALWLFGSYVVGGSRATLLIAVALCVLTLMTHRLVGALLVASASITSLHLYWQAQWHRSTLRRSLIGVATFTFAGIGFAWSWWAETANGVEPTLNPLGLGYVDQLSRAFPASVVPWVVVGLLALIGFCLRNWSPPISVLVATGFGWLVTSVAVFVVTGEPRALIQAQVAVIPVAIAVVWRFMNRLSASAAPRPVSLLMTVVLAGLLGSLAITGLDHYDRSSDWYRVVGPSQLSALAELRSVADEGDLVVASRGPNGNPIGWWVEGYAGLPTYTSIDEKFLAFPDEREQASLAAALFEAPPASAAAKLAELGAHYLILDRRGPDAGWLAGGEPTGLSVVSDGALLVLEMPDGS